MAASSGFMPRVECCHWSCVIPLVMACSTGRFNCSSTETDQPAGVMPPAVISPMAKLVVLMMRSTRPSAKYASAGGSVAPLLADTRSEEVNTGSTSMPRASSAATSASMKAVLPESQCAR